MCTVRDMAQRIELFSIKAVPAAVVDGRLLGCCSNAGPGRDELVAAGVGQPRR